MAFEFLVPVTELFGHVLAAASWIPSSLPVKSPFLFKPLGARLLSLIVRTRF